MSDIGANKRVDEATRTTTVGHEWDGIEELDTPLPRWWLWTFYACIAFAVGYCVLYPAIPMMARATGGTLGWTSRGQLAKETAAAERSRSATVAALADLPIERVPENAALMRDAIAGGKAAFRVNCVQCHGSGAAGSKGYPNLNDDDWLWGGDLKTIETTITHGVRAADDKATRTSLMPSFGRDGILDAAQIEAVASHVRSLSGKEPGNTAGAAVFAQNCVVCHGPQARGNRAVGAPDLTDAIWLYGGAHADVVASVTNAHAGVMPAWSRRLDPVTIKMLAIYVHSLGGGEKFANAPAYPAATAHAEP